MSRRIGRLLALVRALTAGLAIFGISSSTPDLEWPPTGAGEFDLTVVIDDGQGGTVTWRLTGDPTGGSHPDRQAACRALIAHPAALKPVRKDQMCTQIYGGPATARVTGTWQGQPVASRFSLVNGCEIARWRALTGLLPTAGA